VPVDQLPPSAISWARHRPSSVRQSASRNVKNATFRQLRAPERYVARESATHEGDPRAVCCRSSKMHTCVRSEGCARGALRPETPSTSGWKSKGNFAPACTSRWRKRASGSSRSCKATSTTMRYRETATPCGPSGQLARVADEFGPSRSAKPLHLGPGESPGTRWFPTRAFFIHA